MSYENDEEFLSDEDIESGFDALVEFLRMIDEEDKRAGTMTMPNPRRLKEMEESVRMIEKLTKEHGFKVKIEFGIREFTNSGYVRLQCPYGFAVTDVPELVAALEKATNVEFVVENNVMQIGLIYRGCVTTAKLEEQ